MRFGLIGQSYIAKSRAIACEETINWFQETLEAQPAMVRQQPYGGESAGQVKSLLWTPGTKTFATLPEGPVRGQIRINSRYFAVGGSHFCEVTQDGTVTDRGTISNDAMPVSIVASNIQILIVSYGKVYCFDLATNALTDVTASLAGTPMMCEYSDGYGIVQLAGNKFQISGALDFTTWDGLLVSEISVFPEDIVSIIVNHRELWVFGSRHAQPYQDTGSEAIFDAIPGTLMEMGSAATFGPCRVDNTIFWVSEDERGARQAWRASGYSPQRISTHAVEIDLDSYSDVSNLVTYSYQDGGHLFWVIYIPQASCSWVYDVSEQAWHKRGFWLTAGSVFEPHHSQNHCFMFGKHLVGDWNSGKIYELSQKYYDDDGASIRRVRRSPIICNEMEWIRMGHLVVDWDTGEGPQPPLLDGDGDPRPPQCMVRVSRDRGMTWGNEHTLDCGYAGDYKARSVLWRMGMARYPVVEISASDPIPWTLVDAYMETA